MAHIPFLSHYLERKNIEYQNQLLARQVEEVQNIYLTMRGWRHDYHNHLQSMKAYVEMGQYLSLIHIFFFAAQTTAVQHSGPRK